MRVLAEYAAFLAMSVGAHVLVLSQPGGVGEGPGGAQGTEQVTLAAMPPDLAQIVQDWTRPPDIATTPAALAAPAPDMPAQRPHAQGMAAQARHAPLPLPDVAAGEQGPAIPAAAPPPLPRPAVSDQPALPQLPLPDADPQMTAPFAEQPTGRAAPDLPQLAPDAMLDEKPQTAALPPLQSLRPKARPAPRVDTVPAPQGRPVDPARPAQQARGTGKAKTSSAAPAPTPKAAGPSATQTRSLMAQWGGRVRASVERNKRYPRGTHSAGKVTLRITLSSQGRLQAVSVVRSSGNAVLDRAAIAAVKRTRFPKAPGGLPGGAHRFNLPISFAR